MPSAVHVAVAFSALAVLAGQENRKPEIRESNPYLTTATWVPAHIPLPTPQPAAARTARQPGESCRTQGQNSGTVIPPPRSPFARWRCLGGSPAANRDAEGEKAPDPHS